MAILPNGLHTSRLAEPTGEPPPSIIPDLRQSRVALYAQRFERGFMLWTRWEEDFFAQRGVAEDLGKYAPRLMNGSDDDDEDLQIDTGIRPMLMTEAEREEFEKRDLEEWPDLTSPLDGFRFVAKE